MGKENSYFTRDVQTIQPKRCGRGRTNGKLFSATGNSYWSTKREIGMPSLNGILKCRS